MIMIMVIIMMMVMLITYTNINYSSFSQRWCCHLDPNLGACKFGQWTKEEVMASVGFDLYERCDNYIGIVYYRRVTVYYVLNVTIACYRRSC